MTNLPIKLSSTDLGTVLDGLSRQRINQLVTEGVLARASAGGFDLATSVAAYLKFREQPTATRERLDTARAEALEARTAIIRRDYVRTSDAEDRHAYSFNAVKGELVSASRRIAEASYQAAISVGIDEQVAARLFKSVNDKLWWSICDGEILPGIESRWREFDPGRIDELLDRDLDDDDKAIEAEATEGEQS